MNKLLSSKNPRKGKLGKLKRRQRLYGLLFILPWLIGLFIFVLYPLFQSFNFSLNNIRITPKGRIMTFVGLGNYRNIWLQDMFFMQRLINFLLNTVLQVAVIVPFSLIISLLINAKIKFKGIFRTIFFLPVIVASGPVMNELIGQGAATVPIVNQQVITEALAGTIPTWLADPILNLFSQVILILWNSGVQILIFLAALQKVDQSQYEAAKIDGASGWECFWKITLPTIKPMILLNTIYTIVVLANSAQNEIINLIYSNMTNATRGYGFASAMAWLYAIIVSLVLIVAFALLRVKPDKPPKLVKRRGRGYGM